MKKEIA
jgi:hypothetical protein